METFPTPTIGSLLLVGADPDRLRCCVIAGE
jgi:hypothetical protein